MKSPKKARWMIAMILLGGILMFSLFGYSANKYKVDYNDCKFLYKGAKDSYKVGKTVTLYFDCIATDTDYTFYLDNDRLNVSYDSKKGLVITFTMPNHDVTLRVATKNFMSPYLS